MLAARSATELLVSAVVLAHPAVLGADPAALRDERAARMRG
jgi:hypothetical protein